MISTLPPTDETFLAAAGRLSKRIDTATRQISSGKRVVTAADDPDQVGPLLAARSELSRVDQVSKNLSQIKTEADTAEGALQSAARLMDRALSLGTQGATDLSTAQSRTVLAGEIQSVLDGIVGLTQTAVQGRYIFSGDADQTLPYQSDTGGYAGSPSNRRALHPNGSTFATSHTADAIFDHPDADKSVFGSLRALRDALLANDSPAIGTAIAQARSAGDHLNGELAFYGTVQGRISEATSFAQNELTRLRTNIAAIEDTDLLAASLELNTASRDYQAALSARAKANRGSLFDYIG